MDASMHCNAAGALQDHSAIDFFVKPCATPAESNLIEFLGCVRCCTVRSVTGLSLKSSTRQCQALYSAPASSDLCLDKGLMLTDIEVGA